MADAGALPSEATEVLDFWFGPLDGDGLAPADRRKRWWQKSAAFDEQIRERFRDTWTRGVKGELDEWDETPRGATARIVVLDQFPRNMFRDRAEMFASDPLARVACLEGIEAGRDRELVSDLAVFFYMPLMHSESRVDQHLGIQMFGELVERSPAGAGDAMGSNLDFMRKHFAIVDRFGRFPHRNRLLDRESSAEESAFLETPGSSF